jgi:hypothetical protein
MRSCVLAVSLLMVLLAASACTRTTPLEPSPGPWRLSGTVSGITSPGVFVPLGGATLTVIDGVNLDARTTSDAAGRYAFEALAGGRFTLWITAPGYSDVTPVVELFRDTGANFALPPQ